MKQIILVDEERLKTDDEYFSHMVKVAQHCWDNGDKYNSARITIMLKRAMGIDFEDD